MRTSSTYNTIRNMLSGVINQISVIVLPFLLRTAIIRYFGINYVGLRSLFSSILNVLSVTELGIGAVVSALLYKPIAENDEKTISILIVYLRRCYRILGTIILIMGVCVVFFLQDIIARDYPDNINIYILYFMNLSATVVSYFLFAYKKILLSANQRYDIEVNISTVINIVQTILQIMVIVIWKNFYLFTVIFPLMVILNNLITNYVINKIFPYRFYKEVIHEDLKYQIFRKVAGAFWYRLGSVVLFSIDNIVISGFLGLAVLGQYNNYYYIMGIGQGLQAIIHNSIRPTIGNQIAVTSKKKNQKNFQYLRFSYMIFSGICSVELLCLIQPFISLWLGDGAQLPFGLVILIVINFYMQSCCHMFRIYQEAAGIFNEGKFVPLIGAIVNLFLNLLLIRTYHLYGVVLSTIISVLIILLPGYIWVIWKHYFQNREFVWREIQALTAFTIATVIISVVCNFVCNRIVVTGLCGFILKAIFCALLALILYYVIFSHSSDMRYFKDLFIHLVKRKKNKGEG